MSIKHVCIIEVLNSPINNLKYLFRIYFAIQVVIVQPLMKLLLFKFRSRSGQDLLPLCLPSREWLQATPGDSTVQQPRKRSHSD